jgi:hypothetical protein
MSRSLIHIAAVLFVASVAPAATLQQLSMDELNAGATSIVRATVAGSSAAMTGRTIYTHYRLNVSEVWKGTAVAEVLVPGGAVNGLTQSFPGMPDLQVGTEYILFLWKSPATGIIHLMGLGQGLYTVSRQNDGSMLATRPRLGETMLDKAGRKVADQAVSMALPSIKALAQQAAVLK